MSQFQDNSFDVVIETLVLCSVNDVDQSLREIHRVLKPGGIFCFLDHVKAPDSTWLLRFQNVLTATVSKGEKIVFEHECTFVCQCDENFNLLLKSYLFSNDHRSARKMNLFYSRGCVNHNIKVPPI